MAREYKDSGIEWIGQIPKEWDSIRLKYLCTIQTGNKDTQDATPDGIYPFYVRSPKVEKSEAYSFDGEGILMAGDGVGAGRVFHHVFGKYAVHQRVYRLANITGINSSFLFYYISNLFGKEMDRGSAQSTVPSVRLPMLQNFIISAPSTSEQQKIADYLDKVCGEVDEMVALQETMIEELKAYKQSVITEAVTKGLNPNVPMRNSGIDWIGEIPEHWESKKLKYIIDYIESGTSVNAGNVPARAHEYGVLKTSAVSKYVFEVTENKTVVSEEMDKVSCPVRKNTIIVSRMNTPELVGACGYVEKDYDNIFLPDRLWQVHFVDTVYVKFIWYALRGTNIRNYYSSLSVGSSSSMQNISQSQFSNGAIPISCDVDEQRVIASYLDTKCSEIDSLIALKQAKIEELKEYKKSVIYEYVTGKKEVV